MHTFWNTWNTDHGVLVQSLIEPLKALEAAPLRCFEYLSGAIRACRIDTMAAARPLPWIGSLSIPSATRQAAAGGGYFVTQNTYKRTYEVAAMTLRLSAVDNRLRIAHRKT